ncbi:MAG: peptidylprolyl isomerase [Gammaproteobacteria bacterium]|nr:peptidylprolyl isomerase [Gammaproteobacteria bacterium]
MNRNKTLLLQGLIAITLTAFSSAKAQDNPYPRVLIETTAGPITVELNPTRAPLSVKNFLEYAESGFYEGTIFHRVVANFVIQGGGYTTDLKLKPTRPNISNESGNGLSNLRGTVAMARTGDPHSADSQFFINLVNNDRLDPMPTRWGYAVFGEIVEGMDVVDDIGYGATGPSGPLAKDVPTVQVIIEKVSLLGAAEDE